MNSILVISTLFVTYVMFTLFAGLVVTRGNGSYLKTLKMGLAIEAIFVCLVIGMYALMYVVVKALYAFGVII